MTKTKKLGRPTLFKEEYIDLGRKFSLLGATDVQMAEFFEVHIDTLMEWKKVHPSFSEALKAGKIQADAEIANRLFWRARGYSHPETHVSSYQGQVCLTELTRHYPPDTVACIFWLKNRRPDLWRDKGEEAANTAITIIGGLPESPHEKLPE